MIVSIGFSVNGIAHKNLDYSMQSDQKLKQHECLRQSALFAVYFIFGISVATQLAQEDLLRYYKRSFH